MEPDTDNDPPFYFDLERMKKALEQPFYEKPDHIKTAEEFREWLRNLGQDDDEL